MKPGKWKDISKAYPDPHCECLLHRSMVPVRCSKCGADRTDDNWETKK